MASVKSSRPYSSALREEQAARTRRRIVEAAQEVFREKGYAGATVRDVAERAGVARDTVHAVFGSKARLILAMVHLALVPDDSVANVADTPAGHAVRDELDPRRQVELFADFITGLNARLRPVFEVVRGAQGEPELAEVYQRLEQDRLANMQRYVGWLAARGPLRVSRKRAAETMWAIVSPDVGRLLCDQLGWTQAQHAAWVADTLTRALLDDPVS